MTIQLARRIGQALNVRSETRIRTIDAALRQYVREVPQSPLTPISGSFDAGQVISGTFADARISESSVTQHEAALDIDWSQLTSVPSTFPPSAHNHAASEITSGTFADARIAESNVTQHEAALDIDWSQLTSIPSTFPPEDHLEVGTWTPVDSSGAGLTFSFAQGTYSKHESLVIARCEVDYPATADTSQAIIGGLPYNVDGSVPSRQGFVTYCTAAVSVFALPNNSAAVVPLYVNPGGANLQNAQLSSKSIWLTVIYVTA